MEDVKPGRNPPQPEVSRAAVASGSTPRAETRPRAKSASSPGAEWPVVVAAVCGMLAAWVAAGSTGFLVTPLRHAMAGLLLVAALVALRPSWRQLLAVLVVGVAGVALSLLSGGLPPVDALAVAGLLAAMVFGTTGPRRRVLLLVAVAAGALAIFRTACFAVPTAWWADGAVGYLLGRLAGLFGGESPWVAGSLGGVDLLLVMIVFYVGWLRATPAPRAGRAVRAAIAIVLVQVVYLVGLSYAPHLAAMLPEAPMPESFDPGEYRPTDWSVLAEIRGSLPWSLPLAAAGVQALVAAAMLRWTRVEASDVDASGPPLRSGPGTQGAGARGPDADDPSAPGRGRLRVLAVAAVVVAAVTGVLASFSPRGGDLSGKKVVACDRGYVDWIVPTHEALDPARCGSYGLLPSLVADLGGQWSTSGQLSKEDLDKADVVVVIHPIDRWPEDQRKRLEEYVRGGGSLLVVAGPMVEVESRAGLAAPPGDAAAEEPAAVVHDLRPVNDLLRGAGMAIRHDVALSPAEAWTGAIEGSTHPAVFGLSQRTLGLCLRQGSTIETRWPSRPILVGRWGWSEPGVVPTWAADTAADTGEKWGDLVLAAERRVGRGTVVALGDYWCLTNLGVADGYNLAGRLLGYLANRPSSPQTTWRQTLAILGFLGLFVLVVWRPGPARLLAIGLTLAAVLAVAAWHAETSGPVPGLADGSAGSKHSRPVAYIDASHLEVGNDRPWANDGTDGLLLTLARNGYLPLKMERWDPERLERAKLLVVMAPARPFSAREIREIHAFVERGGCLVCMIGATEAAANRDLLAALEFDVPPSPSPTGAKQAEAEPTGEYPDHFGRFRTYYLNAKDYGKGDYMVGVWFLHAWPVHCTSKDKDWQPLVYGYGNQPLVIHNHIGKGSVVLVGDSHFGLNFIHGYYDGQLVESAQDNADFWRWMLGRVTGREPWFPPNRTPATPSSSFRGRTEVMR